MSKFTLEYQGDDKDVVMEFDGDKDLDDVLQNIKQFLSAVGYGIGYDEILDLSLPDQDVAVPQYGLNGQLTGVYMRELGDMEFVPLEDTEVDFPKTPVAMPFRISKEDEGKHVKLRNNEVYAIIEIKEAAVRSPRPVVLSNGVHYPRTGMWYGVGLDTQSEYDIIEFTEYRG